MKIIDCHTHLGISSAQTYNVPDTPEDMINELKAHGISGALFCPMAATMCRNDEALIRGNEEAWELYNKYPDFLYPGPGFHPDFFEKSLYYMDKFCEAGIVWTGENLSYHSNILFSDERWMRIFRIACERHLIVQLHNAPEVEYVAKNLPELTIVGSHLNPDVIPHLVDYPNVYIDISGMHGGVVRGHLRRAKSLFGAERLLFGTDYPGYDVLPFIEICKRDLSIEEQEKVFAGNLLGLLKKHGAKLSGAFAL